jgi:hypothetical protein
VSEKCETCRFWVFFNDYGSATEPDRHGECRRRSPVALERFVGFPLMQSSSWCGEHQPKEEAKAIVTAPVEVPAHLAEAQRKVIAGALARKNTDYLRPTDY